MAYVSQEQEVGPRFVRECFEEQVAPQIERRGVSLDMSGSFAPAIRSALPQAMLVIDHFHVIQHLMKAFRKVVTESAKQGKGQILLHHKQSLFLKPLEKLTQEQKQERSRIASHLPALEANWRHPWSPRPNPAENEARTPPIGIGGIGAAWTAA